VAANLLGKTGAMEAKLQAGRGDKAPEGVPPGASDGGRRTVGGGDNGRRKTGFR
jgi:hypothetical protein